MIPSSRWILLTLGFLVLLDTTASAADLVALSPQTWDRYAPTGKEADAIYGDISLSNGFISAVIAQPKHGRNANMTVRDVGGSVIDLTVQKNQSDQLSAFYPGAGLREWNFGGVEVESPEIYEAAELDRLFVKGRKVTLRLVATPREHEPDIELAYTLDHTWSYLLLTTTFTNHRDRAVEVELVDAMRADGSFEFPADGSSDVFWAFDRHFGQAYGLIAGDNRQVVSATARKRLLRYADREGKVTVRLAPGESYRLVRRLFPASNLFDVRRIAQGITTGKGVGFDWLEATDDQGHPVVNADVTLARKDEKPWAWGRTDGEGRITVCAPEGPGNITVSAIGYGTRTLSITGPGRLATHKVVFPATGRVVSAITNEQGEPIPCKVQFVGAEGAISPDFGPPTGEFGVKNVMYSPNGRFHQQLDPGTYDVIISHGPEYDAVFEKIKVVQGTETPLKARLVRSVKTDGWISTDFHSHSSPSGDNTSSQLGRVLNLLCEQIEFAPCTEHNRLTSYDAHLQRIGAVDLMATCVGMELTGTPLPLNHQNAFPLVMRPHTQDGGGPITDADPAIQIARLALWDQSSDKLVQVNHPDIGWMFHDRNGDSTKDTGFTGMFGHIDVLEVHPPHLIFAEPLITSRGAQHNNTIRNWLQLLNEGRRIPGVVNTDAHENFHGSGWLRNFVKSPTDDPAEIKTLDVVHAAEKGNLVMSNGPFLEVSMKAQNVTAIPGELIAAPDGKVLLKVRVQCPNWFDVDRVQVFINGLPAPTANFTRAAQPDRFSGSTVKFDQEIALALPSDAHVVVATIGEHSRLGPVMGPSHADSLPVAVSNPIYVDVDGQGFKPNGDEMGQVSVKQQGE